MNLRGHRLGWIGLGRMGCPIAERLARAGCDVTGHNRTRARGKPLEAAGGQLADRPAALAGHDIVFTMVSTAADLEAVLAGPGGLLTDPGRAPRILVDCSTLSAEDSARIRATAAAVGSSRVDLQACKLEYSIVSPK